MLKIVVGLLLHVMAIGLSGAEQDLSPCIVYIQGFKEFSTSNHYGSGFLVRTTNSLFIVTAEHVARAVGDRVKFVFPNNDGKSTQIISSNIPWRFSATADVAVTHVRIDATNRANQLARGAPIELISDHTNAPSRDITLTVFGYPLQLGVEGYVSPISRETKAASGLMTLKRFDTKTPATVFILQDPSVGGFSGGPVFDTGIGFFGQGSLTVRRGCRIVGIIHGTLSDDTGGKFSAVVPSTEILKVLREEIFATSINQRE